MDQKHTPPPEQPPSSSPPTEPEELDEQERRFQERMEMGRRLAANDQAYLAAVEAAGPIRGH